VERAAGAYVDVTDIFAARNGNGNGGAELAVSCAAGSLEWCLDGVPGRQAVLIEPNTRRAGVTRDTA
jgi:hypothetical protein